MVDRDTALPDVAPSIAQVQDPLPTEEELHAQCLQLFKWLDADGDGKLSTVELQVALEGLGLPNGGAYIRDLMAQVRDAVQYNCYKSPRSHHRDHTSNPFSHATPSLTPLSLSHMAQYDSDGDGAVTFTEFEKYVQRKEHTLWEAFCRVDIDRNGHLDRNEVQRAFQGGSWYITHAYWVSKWFCTCPWVHNLGYYTHILW